MPRPSPAVRSPRLPTLLVVVLIIAVLYFGREVLVPVALAILLGFLLAPLVRVLERVKLPRTIAAILAICVAVGAVGGVAWVAGGEVVELAAKVPVYRANLRDKLIAIRATDDNVFTRAERTIEELQQEVKAATPDEQPAGEQSPVASPEVKQPTPVEVVKTSPVGLPTFFLGPVLGPLATVGIAIVLTLFLLIQREDIRDRFLRLVGRNDLPLATQALDDASARVSRYLVAQSFLNGCVGLVIGIGLYLLEVPNAALFGLLIGILRFLPYVGYWLAGLLPLAVAWAIHPGWYQPLMVFGLLVVVEVITGNFIEPVVQGAKVGVSTIGILIAALFWAWLWGSVGLLLATPLTVCLAVIGRHVPQFEYLNVLLGDKPVLPPEARVYQRLLAMDQEEAAQIVESEAKGRPPAESFDELILPALRLAKADLHRGNLERDQADGVFEAAKALAEDLAPVDQATAPAGRVVCVPAFDHADEVAASMLAMLLMGSGVPASVLPAGALSSEAIAHVQELLPSAVVLSCLPPQAVFHARHRVKRLRARFPDLPIVIGLWGRGTDPQPSLQRLEGLEGLRVVTAMGQAVDTLRAIALVEVPEAESLTSAPAAEAPPRR